LLERPGVCGSRETPFARGLSPSKLHPREAVAVCDPQAKIAFFDRPFCFPLAQFTSVIHLPPFAFSP